MVKELHRRGFGRLRVIPSLDPAGPNWYCSFVDEEKRSNHHASGWLVYHEHGDSKKEVLVTVNELADLFEKENKEFLNHCKGSNEAYIKWYGEMLEQLSEDELPYAMADFPIPEGVWITSKGREIETLPDEREYYY